MRTTLRSLLTAVTLPLLLAPAARLLAQTTVSMRHQSRDVDFSAAVETKPFKTGTTLPATCAAGAAFFKTDAPAGQNLYLCVATNTWMQIAGSGGGGGGSLPTMSGNADGILSTDGFSAAWRMLAGDVTGAPQNVTVTRLRGTNIGTATPTDGQALVYEAANTRYAPRTVINAVQASTGLVCATSAGAATCRTDDAVVPYYLSGAGVPTYSCQTGRDFYTDTTAGALYFCRATNTWQLLSQRRLNVRTATDTLNAAGLFAGVTPWAAQTLAAGSVVEAVWAGAVTATGVDVTMGLEPVLGAASLADAAITTGLLTDGATLPWQVRTSCIVLTAGAAGTMECMSTMAWGEGPGARLSEIYLGTATRAVDTTAPADFRLALTAVGGTGTLSATLRFMKVEVR
ncbi:MAG: hypothetical protein IT162_12380 [Bryobacterales bacterium]|nr:hypothetical protein [Bryobacterales bacterium]